MTTTFFEIKPNTFLPDWSDPMPRKSATLTVSDTLMAQAATDSRLGDLDEAGLEVLPEFTAGTTTGEGLNLPFPPTPEPTHEERLADLDARDERLNGSRTVHLPTCAWGIFGGSEPCDCDLIENQQNEPESTSSATRSSDEQNGAVRPSEQCGILAGGGPYPGRRCTYREHPMNQPHSWEVASDPTDLPGHVYDDDEAAQPTLPGTPEPEFDERSVPVESAFNDQDFMSAPGLRAIADAWISETEELAHLRGIVIRYFWKRRGGLKGGNPRLGNLSKPSGITKYSLGHPTLLLWLAADHCRDLKLDHEQIRAAVLHELCKASTDPDDHSAFRVVGPDAEVFALEIRLVGLWSLDLKELGANVKQLGLLDGIELPDLTGADTADEPEEGEASDEYILASLEASEGEADE